VIAAQGAEQAIEPRVCSVRFAPRKSPEPSVSRRKTPLRQAKARPTFGAVREFFANVRFLAAASALAACGSVARPPANNTAGFGIRIFGRAFRIEGVTIQNCVQDGLWTEGNRAAFTDQAADLEPTVFRVRGIRNTGNGWTHRGPNDLSFKFNGGGANMQRRHRDHEGDRMLDWRRVATAAVGRREHDTVSRARGAGRLLHRRMEPCVSGQQRDSANRVSAGAPHSGRRGQLAMPTPSRKSNEP
jgi:hypothetical protein